MKGDFTMNSIIIYFTIGSIYGFYSINKKLNEKTYERLRNKTDSIIVDTAKEAMKNKPFIFIIGLFFWVIALPLDIKEFFDNKKNI